MSLDKAIYYRKEYREPYYRSGRFDYSCRPHGSCPYCWHNRFHRNMVRMLTADETAEDLNVRIKGRKISQFH